MNLIQAAINRSRTTVSLLVLLVLAGLYARSTMVVETNPDVTAPFVSVVVNHDGISPEDAVRLLVKPLEGDLRALDSIEEITAVAREGGATFMIEFDASFDIDQAVSDVRDTVDRAKAELPDAADEPVIDELVATSYPAIVVTLAGEGVSERSLYRAAQRLQDRIETLSSVLEANLVGHREEVAEAVIDPARLQSYQISHEELARAVLNNNRLIPAGQLDTGKGRFSVKVPGLIEDVEDVYNLPIKSTSEGVITLSDVAVVRRTFKDAERFTQINGERAIALEVHKRTDANMIAVAQEVRALSEAYRTELPAGITLDFVFDQSGFAEDMVAELQGNIVTAMALVMVIVVAALGVRSGLLVGLGIPVSLLASLIAVSWVGYTFNFMVMFGMLLALGMLIDGAIVVIEFADRKMAEGMNSAQAYQLSVQRMFWPVLASTATTLAAFLPLMFWPGVSGEFMRILPVTVFAVLVSSLLYALVFAPVLGAQFGRNALDARSQQYLQAIERDDPTQLAGITGRYARLLDRLLNRPWVTFAGILGVLVLIYVSYGQFGRGVEFFADTEKKYGQATVQARGNLSAEEIRAVVSEVEQRVLAFPEVRVAYTTTQTSSGGFGQAADQVGSMLVELVNPDQRELNSKQTFAKIRAGLSDIPGVQVSADHLEDGPPVGKPVQIQLASYDDAALLAATRYVRDYIEANVDGLIDIEDSTPLPGIAWELTIDRAQAALYGADVTQVGNVVQLVTNGVMLGTYRPSDADDEVEIRVRYPYAERGLSALDELRINTPNGPVPISLFVQRTPEPQVSSITRLDGKHIYTVKADVAPGVLADDKVKEISAWLDSEARIDPNVEVSFRGANEEQADSAAFLGVAFVLALFLMAVLLVTQFNSFYQAGLILSAVIMSTAGVLLGLLITQSTFSVILTGVGIVALAGIVVNNNIIFIDTYNVLRKERPQLSPRQAVIQAGAQRLRPVFLTTLTTILGLLPIAMHVSVDLVNRQINVGGTVASYWVALAQAIVSGLAFATLLTLVVTPVMLLLPHHLPNWRGWLRQRWRTVAASQG